MENKLLLVSFPIDLGNAGYEKRLIGMFQNLLDLKVYRFVEPPEKPISHKVLIRQRFLKAYSLSKEVQKAQREGRKVLFHGISPALFAYPFTKPKSSYILTDWTRKLYEPMTDVLPSPSWLTFVHKKILNSQKYVMGMTDAVIEEMVKDYNVSRSKLKKAKLPFSQDLEIFIPSPQRQDNEVRILFVGGDMYRKGGDILLDWFAQQNDPNIRMTMVTKSAVKVDTGATIETNIQYGQPQHIELFKTHDIFVLPTLCDGYPAVLGEAACAGLAILTTKNALGAPEIIKNGINGYICNSQEDLLNQLNILVKNKPLIEDMKKNSREFMEKEFSLNRVSKDYIDIIFEN
ncbi:hypothetical protein BV378_13795 [Nostoc sp. RF31YmG]|nr:hypothetical protein BV378_13795 [Nostoc sp. RF31YmG]